MSSTRYGYCNGCDCFSVLLKHHWFDNNEKYYSKMVCPTCNNLLLSHKFGIANNHHLPSWDIQRQFLLSQNDLSKRKEVGELKRLSLIEQGITALLTRNIIRIKHKPIQRNTKPKVSISNMPHRTVSIRMPLGLYERAEHLATLSHLPVHSYLIKTIWTATNWNGK